MSSNFKYKIDIPVQIGETIWTFSTKCCNACLLPERNHDIIKCEATSACHTIKHKIYEVLLSFSNLEYVLRDWGKFFFHTKEEAEKACNNMVSNHIAEMRKLGYDIDDEGRIIFNKESEG